MKTGDIIRVRASRELNYEVLILGRAKESRHTIGLSTNADFVFKQYDFYKQQGAEDVAEFLSVPRNKQIVEADLRQRALVLKREGSRNARGLDRQQLVTLPHPRDANAFGLEYTFIRQSEYLEFSCLDKTPQGGFCEISPELRSAKWAPYQTFVRDLKRRLGIVRRLNLDTETAVVDFLNYEGNNRMAIQALTLEPTHKAKSSIKRYFTKEEKEAQEFRNVNPDAYNKFIQAPRVGDVLQLSGNRQAQIIDLYEDQGQQYAIGLLDKDQGEDRILKRNSKLISFPISQIDSVVRLSNDLDRKNGIPYLSGNLDYTYNDLMTFGYANGTTIPVEYYLKGRVSWFPALLIGDGEYPHKEIKTPPNGQSVAYYEIQDLSTGETLKVTSRQIRIKLLGQQELDARAAQIKANLQEPLDEDTFPPQIIEVGHPYKWGKNQERMGIILVIEPYHLVVHELGTLHRWRLPKPY